MRTGGMATGLVAAMVAALVLAGCSRGLPGSERMFLDGDAYDIAMHRGAAPVVVFASDVGRTKGEWRPVYSAIAAANATFAWDRPGLGGSAASLDPRDGTEVVDELEQLLRARNVTGPLVLVGDGSGGLYMQLFARLHPQRIAGLVLVNPVAPATFGLSGGPAARTRLPGSTVRVAGLGGAARAEYAALTVTGEEVRSAPALPADLPVVLVMSREPAGKGDEAAADAARQAAFARLWPGADVRIVEGGPALVAGNPEAVISAIQAVLARADKSDDPAADSGGGTP